MTEDSYPCPSCGFLVFDEPSGSYDICQICGWEDDHVQLRYPSMRGGANGDSLVECQQAILREIPALIREHASYRRATEWRPLTPADYDGAGAHPEGGLGYFNAATEDSPPYYWLRKADDVSG